MTSGSNDFSVIFYWSIFCKVAFWPDKGGMAKVAQW